MDHAGPISLPLQLQTIPLQHPLEAVDDLVQHQGQIEVLRLDGGLAALHPAQGQHPGDDDLHMLALPEDHVVVGVLLLRRPGHALPQALRVAGDDGDGRFQVVGEVGHELGADLLLADPLGQLRLQLSVGLPQGADVVLQGVRHGIDALAQGVQLKGQGRGAAPGEVQLRDLGGGIGDPPVRPGHRLAEPVEQQQAHRPGRHAHQGGVADGKADGCIGGGHGQIEGVKKAAVPPAVENGLALQPLGRLVVLLVVGGEKAAVLPAQALAYQLPQEPGVPPGRILRPVAGGVLCLLEHSQRNAADALIEDLAAFLLHQQQGQALGGDLLRGLRGIALLAQALLGRVHSGPQLRLVAALDGGPVGQDDGADDDGEDHGEEQGHQHPEPDVDRVVFPVLHDRGASSR